MPLGGGVLVDRGHIYDLIDRLRVSNPLSGEAIIVSGLADEELDTLRRSETEARSQLARAEEEVSRLRRELDNRVGEQHVTKIAEERGRDMMVDADQRAQQLVREAEEQAAERLAQAARVAAEQLEEADGYALQLLQRLEEQIGLFLENVRSGIGQLQDKRGLETTAQSYTHEPMTFTQAEDETEDTASDPDDKDDSLQPRFPWLRD